MKETELLHPGQEREKESGEKEKGGKMTEAEMGGHCQIYKKVNNM